MKRENKFCSKENKLCSYTFSCILQNFYTDFLISFVLSNFGPNLPISVRTFQFDVGLSNFSFFPTVLSNYTYTLILYWLWNEFLISGRRRTRADRCGRKWTFDQYRQFLKDGYGWRTDPDGGRTPLIHLKDGFGQRTIKNFPRRTEADGGRTPSVRLKDGFGRRTGKIS